MMYHLHDYTQDPAGRELRHGAHRIAMEPQVFQGLLFLLEHRDRVVPQAEVLAQGWPETFVSESALTQCLVRLRKAVQATPTAPPVIETLHRQGYRFVAEVTALAQRPPPAPVDTALPHASPALQGSVHPVPLVSSDTPAPPATLPSAPLPPPPARRASPGTERRQLTVLSCAVVDATSLAERLAPEALHNVLMRDHATCTAGIQRYGGHIAHDRGEGLLVYFGDPLAHEDDTQRAIHAGLALLTAVRDLGHGLLQDVGMRLTIRVGMHTGLVVVGAGEGGPSYRPLAIGATLHLAAKMQGRAAPETVVISAAPSPLGQGDFVCQPLGAHLLPDTTEPSALSQVLDASAAGEGLDVTLPQHRTPFGGGREAEFAVLWERVAQVRQGLGQVVLLRGEAGMGKARLVQVVKTARTAEGFTAMEFRGAPYSPHTALHPVSEWWQDGVHGDGDTPMPERMARLEALVQQARLDLHELLPLRAALLRLDLPEERSPALHLTPRRQRQRTLELLVALVFAPVLEAPCPDTVAPQPELLAPHYTEAGRNGPAVDDWQWAGQDALERSASIEAPSHLTTELEVLTRLPTTPERHRYALGLHLTLALALHASKGRAASEIEQAYARAHALCWQVDDTPQRFRVLLGLDRFDGGRRQLQTARELTEQRYRLAQRAQDPALRLEAHMTRGTIALLRGELVTARRHLAQASALYDVQYHRSRALRSSIDPGGISRARVLGPVAAGLSRSGTLPESGNADPGPGARPSPHPGHCVVLGGDVPSVPPRHVGRRGMRRGDRDPRHRAGDGATAGAGDVPPGLGVDGAGTRRRRPGTDASRLGELPGDGRIRTQALRTDQRRRLYHGRVEPPAKSGDAASGDRQSVQRDGLPS